MPTHRVALHLYGCLCLCPLPRVAGYHHLLRPHTAHVYVYHTFCRVTLITPTFCTYVRLRCCRLVTRCALPLPAVAAGFYAHALPLYLTRVCLCCPLRLPLPTLRLPRRVGCHVADAVPFATRLPAALRDLPCRTVDWLGYPRYVADCHVAALPPARLRLPDCALPRTVARLPLPFTRARALRWLRFAADCPPRCGWLRLPFTARLCQLRCAVRLAHVGCSALRCALPLPMPPLPHVYVTLPHVTLPATLLATLPTLPRVPARCRVGWIARPRCCWRVYPCCRVLVPVTLRCV